MRMDGVGAHTALSAALATRVPGARETGEKETDQGTGAAEKPAVSSDGDEGQTVDRPPTSEDIAAQQHGFGLLAPRANGNRVTQT